MARIFTMLLIAIGYTACDGGTETPTSPTVAEPGFTFSTNFAPGGSAARSFAMTAGAIELTLTAATPSVPLGIGIGIPRASGGGCNLTSSTEAQPATAAHLTTNADTGTFCVKVFDVGHMREEVTFSLTVTHP